MAHAVRLESPIRGKEGEREGEKLWNLRRRRRHSPPQLLSRDLFERMLGERPPSQHCEPKWMDRSPVSGIESFRHVDTSPQKHQVSRIANECD